MPCKIVPALLLENIFGLHPWAISKYVTFVLPPYELDGMASATRA